METGIMRKDQVPAGGCDNCGVHAVEPQHVLRKHLRREGDAWLCRKCAEGEVND